MPSIPRAICVPCGREYHAGPGYTGAVIRAETGDGEPYYQIMGDIWVCPECGHRAVVGFAKAFIPFDETGEALDPHVETVVVVV